MTLPEKVGQLFMVGFEGTEVTPELDAWLATYGWGGLIIFGRNVVTPAQLLALTQGVQAAARARGRTPPLIAVDQEGGRVARLKAPFTGFPSAAKVGQAGSERLAYRLGEALATELRAVGITMNMAPVLDVRSNPANTVIGDRAFSTDPYEVARLGVALGQGMLAAGVLAVGKHFPGHGDTLLDSHVALPLCQRPAAQLHACELLPFQAAMAAGFEAIMTAHVVYQAWDSQRPATFSSAVLCDLLRGALGYQGVIVSDDLGMAAIAETTSWEEVPVRCLRAGVDLLLICHQRRRQEQAYASVLGAVRRGELPEALVNRAVARIHRLKSRLRHVLERVGTPAPLTCVGNAEHQALASSLVTPTAQQGMRSNVDGDEPVVG
jgi:beta-N-acetylhexosaminidase